MKKFLGKAIAALAIALPLAFSTPVCHAEVVEGQATVDPSNPAKARDEAMNDAMRTFVEMKVGVHVTSTTEVNMGMVVRDEILAHSDGFVTVNKIIKEGQHDGIYFVRMDLDASDQRIKTAVEDLESRLRAMQDMGTTRSGIEVAVTGRDENGQLMVTDSLMKYVAAKLENAGFAVHDADAAKGFMDKQTDLDDPAVSAKIRQLARNERGEANALLRGMLAISDVEPVGTNWRATAHASFEIVGFESSEVNSFDDYFTAVGANRSEAINKARELATKRAVESLGQKALMTVQSETRGGARHIKATLIVNGITDRAGQPQILRQAVQQVKGRVIRGSFTGTGAYKMFVEAECASQDELKEALLAAVPGLQEGDTDENAMGSAKIYLTF